MHPKSFGVAKWSTLRSVTSWASGSASTSGSPGPAKSLSPMTTSTGQLHATRAARAVSGGRGDRRQAASARAVDLGVLGEAGEVLDDRVGGVAFALDGTQDEVAALGAQQVGPHAGEHEAAEALGLVAGEGEEHAGAEAEADGVDGPVGQLGGHQGLHRLVGLGVVGLVGGAVAEQVDRDGTSADVAEEIEPAVVAPGAGAGGGEAVDEDDGF